MNHVRTSASALALLALLVGGGGCSGALFGSGSCVEFTITSADLACSVDADCSFIDELRVCPGDPECGPENPVNVAAADRYQKGVAGIPRQPVECGAPSPVGCVNRRCAIVTPGDGG